MYAVRSSLLSQVQFIRRMIVAFFFGGERHVIISEAVLKVGLNIPGDADHQPVIFHPGCRKHIASVHDTHKRFRVMQVIDPLCVPFPVRPGDRFCLPVEERRRDIQFAQYNMSVPAYSCYDPAAETAKVENGLIQPVEDQKLTVDPGSQACSFMSSSLSGILSKQ